jgi:hypothetical protein
VPHVGVYGVLLMLVGKDMHAHDSHKSYRPLTTLSFRLDWHLLGERHSAAWSHGMNVVLHGVTSAAFTVFVRTLFQGGSGGDGGGGSAGSSHSDVTDGGATVIAVAAGLLFALHPVHTESVVGVVSRADILCTLFFLVGMALYRSFVRLGDAARGGCTTRRCVVLVGFVAAFYASTLSKELGFGLIAVCGLWELVRAPLPLLPLVGREAVLGAIALPYLVVRMLVSRDSDSLSLSSSTLESSGLIRKAENPFAFLSGAARVLSLNMLQAKYAQLLLFPRYLSAEYSFNCIPAVESLHDARNLCSVAVDAALLCGVWQIVRRPNSAAALATMIMVVTFLPASNIFFRIGACQRVRVRARVCARIASWRRVEWS